MIKNFTIRQLAISLLVAGAAIALVLQSGCGTTASLKLDFTVPKPVITPLEIRMASYYAPEIKEHVFEEEIDNHGKFKIDMTGAHQTLFSTVFGSLFERYVEVDNFQDLPPDVHGLIAPSVAQVQLTLPRQTRSDYYEVWIEYKLQLYDKTGRLVHTWSLPAYGKAHKNNFPTITGTSALALHAATEYALRDAAASMSFYFAREPQVQAWLDSILGAST